MKTKLLMAALLSLLLVACGGSGDKFEIKPRENNASSSVPANSSAASVSSTVSSAQTSSQASSELPVLTGIFVDAAVGGIGYRTATLTGTTNASGEFTYRQGELITFFIGDLEFPPVPGADIITPLDIANTDDINNPIVVNIARLLQSLDQDGDASNGITIPPEAIAAALLIDFTVAPEVFAQLPEVIALLDAAGGPNKQLISMEVALAHLSETLADINNPGSSSSSSSSSPSVPGVWTANTLNIIGEAGVPAEGSIVSQSDAEVVIRATGGAINAGDTFKTFFTSKTYSGEFIFTARLASVVAASGTSFTGPGNTYGYGLMVIQDTPASVAMHANVPRFATVNLFTASEAPTFGGSRAHKVDSASGNRSRSNIEGLAVGDYMRIEVYRDGEGVHRVRRYVSTNGDGWTQVNSTAWAGTTSDNWHFGFYAAPGEEDLVITFNNISVVPYGEPGGSSSSSSSEATSSSDASSSSSAVSSSAASSSSIPSSGSWTPSALNMVGEAGTPASGSVTESGSQVVVRAKGGAINQNDTFKTFFAHKQYNGEFIFTARLASVAAASGTSFTGPGNTYGYGLMVMQNTPASVPTHAEVPRFATVNLFTASDVPTFAGSRAHKVDSASGNRSRSDIADLKVGDYMRIEVYRDGEGVHRVRRYVSANGSEWTQVNSTAWTGTTSDSWRVGFYAAPGAEDLVITFNNISLVPYGAVGSSSSSSSSVASVSSSSSSSSSEVASSSSVVSSSSEGSSSSENSSSEGSSSSASVEIVNTPLPFIENFNSVVDAPGFFSVGYKALASEEAPFYFSTSGTPGFSDGAMTLANSRFTLGNTTPGTLTTNTDTVTTGELNLSQPYRISFCVIETNGAGNLIAYVDNNTTSQGASINLNPSRILNQALGAVSNGQRVVINSSVGSATSFIQLRVDSAGSATIDDLWIGYQSDTTSEPAAETCVGTAVVAPATPAAPSLTTGDSSLSVSWTAVAGATNYDLLYNTVNSTDGATPFAGNPVVGTSANITGLTNGTNYYVFVRARNATGDSDYSASANAAPEEPQVGEPGDWIGAALNLVGTSDIAPSGTINVNEVAAVTLTSTGGNLASAAHNIFFAYTEIQEGNFAISARIASVEGANIGNGNSYRFGVMAMSNIEPAPTYAELAAWADIGFFANGDPAVLAGSRANMKTDGTRSRSDIAGLAVGHYVKIEIYDDGALKRVRRLTSIDGVNYTQLNSTTDFKATSETDNWFVGFFAAAGENTVTVQFDNILVSPL